MNRSYVDTVNLMLDVAPHVFRGPHFAMKGGTALNLFVHDMPRLSVDIDVVFVDRLPPREAALKTIKDELTRLSDDLQSKGFGVSPIGLRGDDVKFTVSRNNVPVKVDVNHVFRGTLLPVEQRKLAGRAREMFTRDLEVPVIAEDELYGGKIVAALDRQHPRDFFDVREMLTQQRFGGRAVDCVVCYLAGHDKSVPGVLFSPDIDLRSKFENEFEGMTSEPVSLKELEDARAEMRRALAEGLEDRHKQFLLSLVRATPDWGLMPFDCLSEMPALRWKLQNLENLKKKNPKKFQLEHDELARRFG